MSQNTSRQAISTRQLILCCTTIALVGCAALAYVVLRPKWEEYNAHVEAYEATVEAERALTQAHGDEVREVIEQYNARVGGFDTAKDPSLLSELATGPYLEYLRDAGESLSDAPSWYVTSSVHVEGVRVLEYTPDRFRAIGCGVLQIDRVTSTGQVMKTLPPSEFWAIFVFVREDGAWKAVAALDTIIRDTFARDWEYVPDWMKDELGDVPSDMYKGCLPD